MPRALPVQNGGDRSQSEHTAKMLASGSPFAARGVPASGRLRVTLPALLACARRGLPRAARAGHERGPSVPAFDPPAALNTGASNDGCHDALAAREQDGVAEALLRPAFDDEGACNTRRAVATAHV